MRRAAKAAPWLVAVAVVSSTACGYRLIGTQVSIPGGIRSVSVGRFENRTREFGLEQTFAFAFEREVYRRGLLRFSEHPQTADGILSGVVREFTTRPVAFDPEDEALEYEATLTVELTLNRREDGKVLWRASELSALEEYSVNRNIVVPSTASFQLGTTNFADLENLTDIQLAESEKRSAIDRLVETIVRDAHDRMVEDF